MSITSEQYERLMRFMDAEMDAEEMADFENELSLNVELRQQLDFEQSLRDGMLLNSYSERGESATRATSMTKSEEKTKNGRKWIAACAAAVATVFFLAVFWRKPPPTPIADVNPVNTVDIQPEMELPITVIETKPAKENQSTVDLTDLFKRYFKKDTIPEEYPILLAEALLDYEGGRYKTLQQLDLNNLPQTRSVNTDSATILQLGKYYKGLSFLETGNTKEAINNLNWVLQNNPEKAILAKTRWYLALAYLKENNKEKAVALCNSIIRSKENHNLVTEAKEILSVLRQ